MDVQAYNFTITSNAVDSKVEGNTQRAGYVKWTEKPQLESQKGG